MAIDVPGGETAFDFSADYSPLLRVRPGVKVRFRTSDASYADLTGDAIDSNRVNFRQVNRLVGPVSVEGAMPGDAVGIAIHEITPADRAFVVYPARWRSGTFGLNRSIVLELPVVNGFALLPNGGRIGAEPMIGCIGVAPKSGVVSGLSPAAPTGGNMDLVELHAGSTIWFPVEVEGALISLGDIHLKMGRGEPVGAGLECAGEVIASVTIRKHADNSGPIIEDRQSIHFVGCHHSDVAVAERTAVRAAWDWLRRTQELSDDVAFAICAAHLNINMGGPAGANVVASFQIDQLQAAGVKTGLWS